MGWVSIPEKACTRLINLNMQAAQPKASDLSPSLSFEFDKVKLEPSLPVPVPWPVKAFQSRGAYLKRNIFESQWRHQVLRLWNQSFRDQRWRFPRKPTCVCSNSIFFKGIQESRNPRYHCHAMSGEYQNSVDLLCGFGGGRNRVSTWLNVLYFLTQSNGSVFFHGELRLPLV